MTADDHVFGFYAPDAATAKERESGIVLLGNRSGAVAFVCAPNAMTAEQVAAETSKKLGYTYFVCERRSSFSRARTPYPCTTPSQQQRRQHWFLVREDFATDKGES